jgi:hypothetical protein
MARSDVTELGPLSSGIAGSRGPGRGPCPGVTSRAHTAWVPRARGLWHWNCRGQRQGLRVGLGDPRLDNNFTRRLSQTVARRSDAGRPPCQPRATRGGRALSVSGRPLCTHSASCRLEEAQVGPDAMVGGGEGTGTVA